VTAGNASGVNDGAAAMIIASEKAAKKAWSRRPSRASWAGRRAGVAPRIMGIGPVPATLKLCALTLASSRQDFDVIELNEAFASARALPCCENWALPTMQIM
jgi:acetyl-CoA acyltransferase